MDHELQRRRIEHLGSGRARLGADDPQASLADDEIEGRTLASLVSPGTELQSFLDASPEPRPSGYAAVFRVERVGAAVTGFTVGDTAFAMGPHASHQRVAASEATIVPDGLAAEAAVFARLMSVSWTTLVTTRARPADRVLVTGLGIVGHLAAQVFHAAGYRVTGVDPVQQRRDLAARAGIPEVLAEAPVDPDPEGGFALVVECSGHEDAVIAGCLAARRGAEVVLVGVPWRRRSDATAFDVLHAAFHRYLSVRSGWEWELPRHPEPFGRGSIAESFSGALLWLAQGRVDVTGLASTARPEDAEAVFSALAAGDSAHLTTIFDWDIA